MESKLVSWLIVLLMALGYWFYSNLTLSIDYKLHPQLIDKETGTTKKPRDLFDLAKVISHSKAYIKATNAQERLYDLHYLSIFENPFIIDSSYSNKEQLELSGLPVANQQLCSEQLGWLQRTLSSHRNFTFLRGQLGYELTNFMDSFGRIESGYYSGVGNSLGSYKQCLKSSLNSNKIKTRYCIARMRPKWWPSNETIYPRTTIRLGICLPETCDTSSLQPNREIIDTLVRWDMPELLKDGLNLESIFCLPDERSPIRSLPASGKIYIFILLAWCSLIVFASIVYEAKRRNQRLENQLIGTSESQSKNKPNHNQQLEVQQSTNDKGVHFRLLEAMSLRCSLKALKSNTFKVNYALGQRVRVNLGALDFFKINMAVLIVLGHSGYLAMIFARSLGNRVELGVQPTGKMTLSVSRCVDTFYLFFGLLTTYTLMRKFTTRQLASPLVWFAINLGVFLRIAPMFMLVYWFSHSLAPYLGSGPWWDYGVDARSMRGVCMADEWWKSIPYFGSLGSPSVPSCLLPAWFIVSYSQLALILPLISYIIIQLPGHRWRLLFSLLLLGLSTANIGTRLYNQTSVREEAFTIYGGFLSDVLEKFESTGYLTTFGRLGSSTFGCFIGYLLRSYELNHISRWPSWLTSPWTIVTAFVAHLVVILMPLFGHWLYVATGKIASLQEFVAFNSLFMFTWPLLNGLIIIPGLTVLNHTAPIRFFSHSFWHSFNRLGLAIYLVHWEILFMSITHFEQAPSYGFVADVFKLWAFALVLSILIALVIHLFVEAPLSRLLLVAASAVVRSSHEHTHDLEDTSQKLRPESSGTTKERRPQDLV